MRVSRTMPHHRRKNQSCWMTTLRRCHLREHSSITTLVSPPLARVCPIHHPSQSSIDACSTRVCPIHRVSPVNHTTSDIVPRSLAKQPQNSIKWCNVANTSDPVKTPSCHCCTTGWQKPMQSITPLLIYYPSSLTKQPQNSIKWCNVANTSDPVKTPSCHTAHLPAKSTDRRGTACSKIITMWRQDAI